MPGITVEIAGSLLEKYPGPDDLRAVSATHLQSDPPSTVKGIGATVARFITDYFASARNFAEIERLLNSGIGWPDESAPSLDSAVSGAVSGKALPLTDRTFVITGKFEGYSRDQIKAEIVARGGKVTGSVSGKTSALICGDAPGSKLTKAQGLGIEVIDEAALAALLA